MYAEEIRSADGAVIQATKTQDSLAVLKKKTTNVIREKHKFTTQVQQCDEHVLSFTTSVKILLNLELCIQDAAIH